MRRFAFGKKFLSFEELVGKTLLIHSDGRILPVFCYEISDNICHAMQIRGKHYNDDVKSNWLVGVGNHGLREDSVAIVARQKEFGPEDVVRVLGLVSPNAVDSAQQKAEIWKARPAMQEKRRQTIRKIAEERRKGHRTKGLNKILKKLNRTLDAPQKQQTHGAASPYAKVNPKPMQGGKCSGR